LLHRQRPGKARQVLLQVGLQRLGIERGFFRHTLHKSLTERFPRAHQVIADFLGVPRQSIWPQFYHPNGEPKSFKQVRVESVQQARAA
jgi:lambda repressor-like predicted transcriptional regulator